MGSLRIVVLYDRVLVDETEEQGTSTEKSPDQAIPTSSANSL